MRKFLCVLLAMVLAVGVCAPSALAAETPTVSISSGSVAPGGEVTLTVSIKDNPGIAGMVLYIYYDTSLFTADPDQDVDTLGDFRTGGTVGNTIALARTNRAYDGDEDQDGLLILWYSPAGRDISTDGEVFTVTLHALATTSANTYEIGVGYSQKNTCNVQSERLTLVTQSGTVTVAGSGTQTTPDVDPDKPSGGTPTDPSAGKPGSDQTVELFSDIAGNWAEAYITRAAERKLVLGYEGKYRPQDSMTRAELVTLLWRAKGKPEAKPSTFTDLTQDWYMDAIAWAEETGVVNGIGEGRFDPDGHITREQLAAVLHRMAGSPTGMEAMLTGLYDQQFTDSAKVSSWAKASMYWTYYTEILCGNEKLDASGELAPQADATRAQIAVMVIRYLDRMEKGG